MTGGVYAEPKSGVCDVGWRGHMPATFRQQTELAGPYEEALPTDLVTGAELPLGEGQGQVRLI